MTLDDCVKKFGSKYAVGKFCGLHPGNVYNWARKGEIPFGWQLWIARATKGELKPDVEPRDMRIEDQSSG